jgi:hypothetical protein
MSGRARSCLFGAILVALVGSCIDPDNDVECVQDVDCGQGAVCNAEGACEPEPLRSLARDDVFECKDNTRVELWQMCDGVFDCCDGADEEEANCPENTGSQPTGWTCPAEFFGSDDGCDCGCGELDPDCPQSATVDSCGYVGCVDGPAGLVDGDITTCTSTEPLVTVPEAWTCIPGYYGADDGCDCGCGEPDPDCAEGVKAEDCQFTWCETELDAADISQCGDAEPDRTGPPGCFECLDGNVIPRPWQCDYIRDCRFGEDELRCPGTFVCVDGTPLPPDERCDGVEQCVGGEDEADCPPPFVCDDGDEIVPDWRCDGYADCTGSEDEADCPNIFLCDDGAPIDRSWVCDQEDDCLGAEDEVGCFACGDAGVIAPDAVCDGVSDCPDAQDEADCPADAGPDGGTSDGGVVDAGLDAGLDAGFDGGFDAGFDGGFDAGFDAGFDGGFDAGATDAGDAG